MVKGKLKATYIGERCSAYKPGVVYTIIISEQKDRLKVTKHCGCCYIFYENDERLLFDWELKTI